MDLNNITMILGVLGAIVSPVVTLIGLYLQDKKDKKRYLTEKQKIEAEAEKLIKEADKIRAESSAMGSKADMETIAFYITLVNTLRDDVASLTERSRKNEEEIEALTYKLKQADEEKQRLAADNAELLKRIDKYEAEVQRLTREVAILKKDKKENNNNG